MKPWCLGLMQGHFSLGSILIDVVKLSLKSPHQHPIQLQHKPIEVLIYLAQHYPRLVSREELINAIWHGNHYVGDKALTNVIWQLRHHFKQLESADIIATIRKKGYRLEIAPNWQPDVSEWVSIVSEWVSMEGDVMASVDTHVIPSLDSHLDKQWVSMLSMPNRHLAKRIFPYLIGLTLLMIMVYFSVQPFKENSQSSYQITTLVGGNGRVMHPDLSPDGSSLVFSWQKIGQPSQLFSTDNHQKNEYRQLTFENLEHGAAKWSADGSTIFYSTLDPTTGQCQLKKLDLLTLNHTSLAECWDFGRVYLDVSPDGRFVAFTGYRYGDGNSLYLLDVTQAEAKPQLWLCPALCDGMVRDVRFSKNGRYLALTRRFHRLSEDIFLYDLSNSGLQGLQEGLQGGLQDTGLQDTQRSSLTTEDIQGLEDSQDIQDPHVLQTGIAKQLTFGQEDIIGLQFHKDGKEIVYAAFQHGKRQGFLLDIATGQSSELDVPDFGGHSEISADGTIYFHKFPHSLQLAYIPLAQEMAAGIFPLTASTYRHEMVDFNQSRQALIFVSNESGFSEIWLADPTMQQKKQLTNLKSTIKYPRWSHDGRHIVFVTRLPKATHDQLSVLEVDTGKIATLVTGMQWHGQPSWTHDDRAVMFSADGELHQIWLSTDDKSTKNNAGTIEQLTRSGGSFAQTLPDGRIFFTKGRNSGLFELLPHQQEKLVLAEEQFNTVFAWTVLPQGVYFLHQDSVGLGLKLYDFQQQKLVKQILLPAEQISMGNAISISTDPQRLYLEVEPLPRIDLLQLRHPALQH